MEPVSENDGNSAEKYASLSNQELRMIAGLTGMMFCRYYPKTRVLERLYTNGGNAGDCFQIQENIPDSLIESNYVSPDTAAAYRDFFVRAGQGIDTSSTDVKLLAANGTYRWHQAGDQLLRQAAKILQDSFYRRDTVGRLGGDEFMVLLSGDLSVDFLRQKAVKLVNALNLRASGNKQLSVSVSIGIAYGRGRLSFEKLYRLSDMALYSAKRAGKCRFHLIDADTNEERAFRTDSILYSFQSSPDSANEENFFTARTPYEALLKSIPGGIVIVELGETLTLTHCNDWTTRFTGYTKEELHELEKDNPLALLHPDDVLPIQAKLKQLKEGQDTLTAVYRLLHKDGYYKYLQMNTSLSERSAGKSIFYGVQIDVDELIRIQNEKEASQKKMEALMDAIPGGIAVFSITDQLDVIHYGNWIYE